MLSDQKHEKNFNLMLMLYPIIRATNAIKNTNKTVKEQRIAKRQAKQFRSWLAKPYMFSISQ